MAITKIHPITTTLTKALNYIQNPKKTDGTLLVDGYGCVPETAYQQFMRTKEKIFIAETLGDWPHDWLLTPMGPVLPSNSC